MTDLLAARWQMAISLGFHILFACVGMAMPLLMVIAEGLWIRSRDPVYYTLARRWAKGTAIMFAVGAVSGTVLSFELGLLWPTFMQTAGPIIGMPFSLEGFAFFLEAIFLGIYLYGWEKVPPKAHLFSGVMVMLSGIASGVFVVTANAWMNTPVGFQLGPDGMAQAVDPFIAMTSPAALTEALHMTLAAFVSVGFAVAAIHAWMMLRGERENPFHRKALAIALSVGGVFAFLQPISGDLSAKHLAEHQPLKLAAAEALWHSEEGAPLLVGGIPDVDSQSTSMAIELPNMLSFLAFGDFDARVQGLEEFPRKDWPPVLVVHLAFQIMVACGFAMMALALLAALLAWRKKALPDARWFLRLVVLAGPLGFLAVEAGWTVTEVGRQPWIIHGIMRTKDALTPMPNLHIPLITFATLYLVLGVIVVGLLRRIVFASPRAEELTP